MSTIDAGTAAAEQVYVVDALASVQVLVAALDTAQAVLRRDDQVKYSALRTQVEQAHRRAEAVLSFLRDQ